ncbi:PAAR domain-containing protein [Pseudomonas sp. zfem002]|uniref:PAAR domain-containing protein n=1 Tax=Pseudomonas sp. zfem002 TaxID=3078197 RepID=UPI0029293622|nr:PAAR domain-containing protein [Pseudomonas sp. zfem002]MDU9393813.1 PAAR domain-containing protein [Pseudomonas sp. zfem002]
MTYGYFIRKGDRTTCGGVVVEGDDRINMFGFGHAREGHAVTCGVTGKTYQIVGGLNQFNTHGSRRAGTLHSVSSCPCRAQFQASITHVKYDYEDEMPPPHGGSGAAGQSASPATQAADSSQAHSPSAASAEPADERCSGSFHLLDQYRLPCGSRQYALLRNGACLAGETLNDEGYCHICFSTNPLDLDIAISAPAPALE